MSSGAPFAEQEKQKNLRWQRAFGEERTRGVPAIKLNLEICCVGGAENRKLRTYRALELGPLSSTTFNNVVQADLGIPNMLTLCLTRNRTWCAISTAISVHRIAVIICETAMCTRTSTLETGSRPTLLHRRRISAHRCASTATAAIRRYAALARRPRSWS